MRQRSPSPTAVGSFETQHMMVAVHLILAKWLHLICRLLLAGCVVHLFFIFSHECRLVSHLFFDYFLFLLLGCSIFFFFFLETISFSFFPFLLFVARVVWYAGLRLFCPHIRAVYCMAPNHLAVFALGMVLGLVVCNHSEAVSSRRHRQGHF